MGNDKNNIIDQLFSQQLADAESPVRDSVWEGIAAQVENGRLRKKILFARITAAASFLLLLGFGTFFLWDNGTNTTQQYASGNIISLPQVSDSGDLATNEIQPGRSFLQFSNAASRNLGNFPRAGVAAQLPENNLRNQAQDPKVNLSRFSIDQYGNPKNINKAVGNRDFLSSGTSVPKSRGLDKTSNNEVNGKPTGLAITLPDNSLGNTTLADAFSTEETAPAEFPAVEDYKSIMEKPAQDKPVLTVSPLAEQMFGKNDAKGDSPETPSFNRFSLGGNFSPDYTFASTSPIQTTDPNSKTFKLQDPVEADQTNSEFVSAYSTGINFGYKISQRLGLQTGLAYSNRTTNSTSELDAFGKTNSYNSNFSVSFVEVPLLVQYDLVSRENFSYYVSSGMSANLLWDYDNTLSNPNGRVAARVVSDDANKLAPTQANLLLRTGVKYNILNNLSLNVEPGLRYGILSNEYSFSNGNPLSLSLSTGASFNF